VGTRFSWIFENPRREENIPYDSMLERFRNVRDEIELKIKDWLEHPEAELAKLREQRERERRKRLEAARRVADERMQQATGTAPKRRHPAKEILVAPG
jgi:hypothetical protein